MIITRTPFRISFFGGGTDYPQWYKIHGGQVLATTIDKYCYLSCRYLPPFFDFRHSVTYSKVEYCRSIDEISHPAAREILRHLKIERGVSMTYSGDLPARSGMGSSSSFAVGLLHALHALKGEVVSKRDLALEGIHVEQNILKETVGSQDQVSAAYGGFNRITFSSNGEIFVQPMTLNSEYLESLNDHLMLFYTGIQRTASAVAASFVPTLHTKEAALKAIGDMVKEGVSLLSRGGDLDGFGKLLDEAWQVKRTLGALISNSRVEELYQAARSSGAIGGKLLGAGGGGFAVFFVPPERQQKVREKLKHLVHVPFQFEFSGSQVIFFDREADYSSEEETRSERPFEAFSERGEITDGFEGDLV